MSQALSNVFKLHDVINASDPIFAGGVRPGNTATQNGVAFDALTNFVNTASVRRSIILPDVGTYDTDRTIKFTKSTTLMGPSGLLSPTIRGVGLGAGAYVIDLDGTVNPNVEGVELKNLTVMSNNGTPHLIKANRIANSLFENIGLRDGVNGITFTGDRTFSNRCVRVNHITGLTGHMVFFTAMAGGHFDFLGCNFGGNIGFFADSSGPSDGVAFENCNFEACATNGLYIASNFNGISFLGCRAEKNLGTGGSTFRIDPIVGKIATGITFNGCFFETDTEAWAIELGGTGGKVRGFNISGCYAEGYSTNMVRLNGEGESGLICGNYIDHASVGVVASPVRAGVVVYGNENISGKLPEHWGLATWGVSQGTWTPVDDSGAGLALTGEGFYTKIGRELFWQVQVVYPATANGSGTLIGGLPFSPLAGAGTQGRAGGSMGQSSVTNIVQVFTLTASDANPGRIRLYKAGGVQATNAEASNGIFYFGGHFVV